MTQTYSPKDYDVFIGLDVDKNSFAISVAMDNKDIIYSKTMPSKAQHFYNYIQKRFATKRVICAYETGPTGFHLYDFLKSKSIPCLVVSANAVPKSPNKRVKNNRIDSKELTDYLNAGKLYSIRVPDGVYRELRHLIRIREKYVSSRVKTKQRIKSLLLHENLHSDIKDKKHNWSCNYVKELKELVCSFAVKQRLDMLLEDLSYNREKILTTHRAIKSFLEHNPELKQSIHYLRTIPGIGFITAITILGNIGDPVHLKDVREIGSFAGLVPCEHSTGDNINKGPITHLGNYTLRSLLIEAAWSAIRQNTELSQFYHRIKARNNPKIAAQKAIVATARKLTRIIYNILKEQREYINH